MTESDCLHWKIFKGLLLTCMLLARTGCPQETSANAPASRYSCQPAENFPCSSPVFSRGESVSVSPTTFIVLAAYDNPPLLVQWDAAGRLIRTVEGAALGLSSLTEVDFSSGIDVYAADPRGGQILRLDARLNLKASLKPLTGEPFEPLSLCLDDRQTLYILERSNREVWRLENDRLQPTGWGGAGGQLQLTDPRRIRFDADSGLLCLLDGPLVKIIDRHGRLNELLPMKEIRYADVAFSDRHLLLVGDVFDATLTYGVWSIPLDSLRAWQAMPLAAVSMSGDSLLCVLPSTSLPALLVRRFTPHTEKP